METKSTVGDFVTLQRGITYKGILVGEPGPALLGLGSITPGGGFRESDYKTYGGDCPKNITLHPGDIFASLKGATKDGKMIGSVARVPDSVPVGRLTQDTVKLEFLDATTEISNYLYWILRTPQYRDYCARHATGSAVVALSRDDFLNYPVPKYDELRARIVTLLESIEEKTSLNRQTNQTLEKMAQTLFKSWFVDFDPVIDNALAAGNDIPEPLQARAEQRKALRDAFEKQDTRVDSSEKKAPAPLPESIRQLFPDGFVFDAEMGWIPEGWDVAPLSSIATLKTKSAHPAKEPEKLWTHFSIPSYDESSSPTHDFGHEIKSGKYVVPETAVLASKLNPDTPRVWLPEVKDDVSVCSTEFMPFVPLKDQQRAFLYALLCSEPTQTAICNRATGSTGSRQRVKPKEIAEMPVLIPSAGLMDSFSDHASALYD